MSYMDDEFFASILDFYEKKNWKSILNLNELSNNVKATRILWVWPGEDDLKFIHKVILRHGMIGVSSIGCGSGLLEWILHESTNMQVEGFEVNEEWWRSKYSCPTFINLKFPTFPLKKEILNPHYALLFCYFNSGHAFLDYVRNYRGNLVIIIGPSYGKGRHTDPQPFEAKFPSSAWNLDCYKEIKQTKDFIVCYVRQQTDTNK